MFITHQGKRLWVSREAHWSSTWKSSLLSRVCAFVYSRVDVVALWRCVCLAWASNRNQQLLFMEFQSACFFPWGHFLQLNWNSKEISKNDHQVQEKRCCHCVCWRWQGFLLAYKQASRPVTAPPVLPVWVQEVGHPLGHSSCSGPWVCCPTAEFQSLGSHILTEVWRVSWRVLPAEQCLLFVQMVFLSVSRPNQ